MTTLRVLNNELKMSDMESSVGGLSSPSKMPAFGWSISAFRCNVGSKLRKVEGSTCSKCYAMKGHYRFSNVREAHERRLDTYNENPRLWVDNFVDLLNKKAENKKIKAKKKARRTKKKCEDYTVYFRWFDSGDLQSLDMLMHINEIAWRTPGIKHWLPTRQYKEVRLFRDAINQGDVRLAPNLVIRVSSPMINKHHRKLYGFNGSSTFSKKTRSKNVCEASKNDGRCGSCRKCWDKTVLNVVYPLH